MCIKSIKTKIAKRNIPVWKIFNNLNVDRFNNFELYKLPFRLGDLSDVLRYKSSSGPGYHCFGSYRSAENYANIMNNNSRRCTEDRTIVKLQIPKGYSYTKGIILSGYIGAGMKCICSNKLINPEF